MPRLLYGTAWKKEATADLVFKALKAGFRGVDTAAQPRHYNESLVGAGIKEAISKNIVKREDLFVRRPIHRYTTTFGANPLSDPDEIYTCRWTGPAQYAL
jgi:diketogulonate reductase-like aldo/keto reductase